MHEIANSLIDIISDFYFKPIPDTIVILPQMSYPAKYLY